MYHFFGSIWIEEVLEFIWLLEVVIPVWWGDDEFFLFSVISGFSKIANVNMHTVFNDTNAI